MVYYVSRQWYYYSGASIVEIAAGGLDYAGADMLVRAYPGECAEYSDPREAAAVAIEICRRWRAWWREADPGVRGAFPRVGHGHTGGMGIEIEPSTFRETLDWADGAYAALPKCEGCGDILGKERFLSYPFYDEDRPFCSESCADRDSAECERFNEEIAAELHDGPAGA